VEEPIVSPEEVEPANPQSGQQEPDIAIEEAAKGVASLKKELVACQKKLDNCKSTLSDTKGLVIECIQQARKIVRKDIGMAEFENYLNDLEARVG